MNKYKKIKISLLGILIIAISIFCYLMYAWNYAYSKGSFTCEDGTYTGEFKGKVFEGYGTFTFQSGVRYEGEWKDSTMEGYGVMTYANGSKYEGEFKDGIYNGKGKMTKDDGAIIEGVWKYGKLIERK